MFDSEINEDVVNGIHGGLHADDFPSVAFFMADGSPIAVEIQVGAVEVDGFIGGAAGDGDIAVEVGFVHIDGDVIGAAGADQGLNFFPIGDEVVIAFDGFAGDHDASDVGGEVVFDFREVAGVHGVHVVGADLAEGLAVGIVLGVDGDPGTTEHSEGKGEDVV